jgi:hypothetical protein
MESCRGNGLAVQHLVQAHLEIAHGKSIAAKIMFLSVVMVRDVMPSPKDGIAVLDAKVGRSAPKISPRCATIKNVVAIIVAALLEGAISLDMVAGRAAVKELDLRCSFLRLFFGRSTDGRLSRRVLPVGCAFCLTTRYSILLPLFLVFAPGCQAWVEHDSICIGKSL